MKGGIEAVAVIVACGVAVLAIVAFAILVTGEPEGSTPVNAGTIEVWEDPARNVVCYIVDGDDFDGGLSCLEVGP